MFLQEVQLCLKALKHFLEINMNMMVMWGTRRNKSKLIALKVEKIKPQFDCLPLEIDYFESCKKTVFKASRKCSSV